MSTYYNENNLEAAEWLRELINADQIPDGYIDTRSIVDVQHTDLKDFAQCHFFAGVGVWAYALRQAGWSDDTPVWTGSCPCQPFSNSGKLKGSKDERHLWPVWFELIKGRNPNVIFGEQVASSAVIGRVDGTGENVWWDTVQTDLESASYAVAPFDLPASVVGAPHIRQRLCFVAERLADSDNERPQGRSKCGDGSAERTPRTGGLDGRLGNASSESSERNAGKLPEAQTEATSQGRSDGRLDNGYSDASEVGGMGYSDDGSDGCNKRREGITEKSNDGSIENSADHTADSHNSFWSSADWLGCRDGKFRPVKPGSQCLVNGSTNSMVSSSDPSPSEVEGTKEARAMRLRGYGNAIVAPLAIEFIKAYMR